MAYQGGLYLRISKETEGDSIGNQESFLRQFLQEQEDIVLADIYKDVGYSGYDFPRPELQRLLSDCKEGRIDCILVKDLSRFGRNFVETEGYLRDIFPFLGVRFIAVQDDMDTRNPILGEEWLRPVKNLLNEAYLGDISMKIRSHLEIRRKQGEYLAPFAPYGYTKSPKGDLERVEELRPVIESMFCHILQGYSPKGIAQIWNEQGILSPQGWKKAKGCRHYCPFEGEHPPKWTGQSVLRVLRNPLYGGRLVQGQYCTTGFGQSHRKGDCHSQNVPPLIAPFLWETVQEVLSLDYRRSPTQRVAYPFSGLLFCGDCGGSLCRSNKGTGDKPRWVYLCGNYKKGLPCRAHCVSVDKMANMVEKILSLCFPLWGLPFPEKPVTRWWMVLLFRRITLWEDGTLVFSTRFSGENLPPMEGA